MYRRLHDEFDLKVQLNLFYRTDGFDLSMMSDDYSDEWRRNSDWLKLSFHSELENVMPYGESSYDEVFDDCRRVNDEIRRFSSPSSLASTTTVHYCSLTEGGLRALEDNGVIGLLGLFGTVDEPRTSYGIAEGDADRIRKGEILKIGNISFAPIEVVLNKFGRDEIIERLMNIRNRDFLSVMIHEQYFYEDYERYQPDFEEKLNRAFSHLKESGYESSFFEGVISL